MVIKLMNTLLLRANDIRTGIKKSKHKGQVQVQ